MVIIIIKTPFKAFYFQKDYTAILLRHEIQIETSHYFSFSLKKHLSAQSISFHLIKIRFTVA